MRKSKVIIIITAVLLVTLSVIYYINHKDNSNKANETKRTEKWNKSSIVFANNYINYIVDEEEGFNLFGIQDNSETDLTKNDLISRVEFNNDNIEIKEFTFDTGLTHRDYRLFNLLIDVEVLGDKVERADEVIIYLTDGQKVSYPVGEIYLQNINSEYTDKHIDLDKRFTVAYPEPKLDIDLVNISDSPLNFLEVNDPNKYFHYTFEDAFKVDKDKVINITIENLYSKNKEDFDFYTITPVLSYEKSNETYKYVLPGLLFRILEGDEQKVERIMKRIS